MAVKPNIVKDRLLYSPLQQVWTPEPVEGGSLYNDLCNKVRRNIEEGDDWVWLYNRINGEKMMASEFEILSRKFAVIYNNLGLIAGDTIHLIVGNHNHTFAALGGIWILGGIGSVGDIALDSRAIAGQLKDTNAKLVVCIDETAKNAREAITSHESGTKKKVHLYSFGEVEGVENILPMLEATSERMAPDPVEVQNPKTETCLIFWSSGTTGLPKGICHSHYSTLHFIGFGKVHQQPDTPSVTTTCFFHVGGFLTGTMALEKRVTYHHMFGSNFTLKLLIDVIREVKPSTVGLGAHHYVQLAESDVLGQVEPDDLDSVKLLFPAGSAVPSSCEQKIRKKFRNLQGVCNGYGQTESGIVSIGFENGNLGMIMPQFKVKIQDPNTGKRCGPNETGEICVKTPFSMLCYLKRPKETEEYFDFEEFGHTGDLGFYDNKGWIVYVDRMKEVIKYNNNHVSPTEIEDILQKHEAVQECLVFGKKEPRVQELITAVVVSKHNTKVTENELIEFVNSKVIDYKKIRGGIMFRDEIPRNNVGKLVRRKMREWAEQQQPEA